MTNTYAILTTARREFQVRDELVEMGLHPWLPMQLACRYIPERGETVWYDRPYIGKLMFSVIPALQYRDAHDLRHVLGKPISLSRADIDGTPGYICHSSGKSVPPRPGLRDFKMAVEREYADMRRRRENAEWVCAYQPGDALILARGAFADMPATFRRAVRRAEDASARLRVEVEAMGRTITVEVRPDYVRV